MVSRSNLTCEVRSSCSCNMLVELQPGHSLPLVTSDNLPATVDCARDLWPAALAPTVDRPLDLSSVCGKLVRVSRITQKDSQRIRSAAGQFLQVTRTWGRLVNIIITQSKKSNWPVRRAGQRLSKATYSLSHLRPEDMLPQLTCLHQQQP